MRCTGLGITGVCLIILGVVVGWVAVPKIVRSKIAEIIPLKRGTDSWERWETLPVPIQYRVYVFNVENADEVIEGKIPVVKEVGPYVYDEKRIKNILFVDEERGTVEYEQKVVFEFNKNASGDLSDTDVLTVVNPIGMLLGLAVDSMKSINPVIQLYDTGIKKLWPEHPNPIFTKTSVKDLLFDGMPMRCDHSTELDNFDVKIVCGAFRLLYPKTVTLDYWKKDVHKFAFFNYKNDTSEGVYKMDLGINDVTKIGQILSWNDVDTLSVWKGDSCNKIRGTDTTVFRPYLKEDDVKSLFIYHPDICRSIELVYDSDTEFKGVGGRRYVPSRNFLSSAVNDSNNHCFCPQSVKGITHYGGCLRDGALELTVCQGAPVVVSYPHFLQADPLYQRVKGLAPDVDKHRIFIDLEPNTGYPLRASSRIQINAFLKSIPEVKLMKSLPNVLMPLIWIEEKVELTDDLIDEINSQLLNNLKIAGGVTWAMIALGIVLSLGSICYYFVKLRRKSGGDSDGSVTDWR